MLKSNNGDSFLGSILNNCKLGSDHFSWENYHWESNDGY